MKEDKNPEWVTVKDLAEIQHLSKRSVLRNLDKYITREVKHPGGKRFEILVASLPNKIRFIYHNKIRHLPFSFSNLGNNAALIAIIKINHFLDHPTKGGLLEVREVCATLQEECSKVVDYCKQLFEDEL